MISDPAPKVLFRSTTLLADQSLVLLRILAKLIYVYVSMAPERHPLDLPGTESPPRQCRLPVRSGSFRTLEIARSRSPSDFWRAVICHLDEVGRNFVKLLEAPVETAQGSKVPGEDLRDAPDYGRG